MATINFTKTSVDDLKAIHKNIATKESPLNADRFIGVVRKRILVLEKYPDVGDPVKFGKYKNLYDLAFKNFHVIYHLQKETVTVVAIHNEA
jgi:plasmid stabilization system protein ParE